MGGRGGRKGGCGAGVCGWWVGLGRGRAREGGNEALVERVWIVEGLFWVGCSGRVGKWAGELVGMEVFDWVGGKVRGGEEGSSGKKHECVERWRLHLFGVLVSNVSIGCFDGFRVVMLS